MMANAVVLERPSDYELTTDYDGLWKALIEELFEEFMRFFAPNLYEEIDFSKDYNFLQQELFKEIIKEKKGRVAADQIVKVYLKNGEERWILVHIEVQGKNDKDFAQRMFRYFYRIYDKYNREVYAIALLTDAKASNYSNRFHYAFYGTQVDYTYNVYQFYNQDIQSLEESSNPFASAVIAGIYASKTKNDANKRYIFKRKLMLHILRNATTHQEYTRMYLSALFDFIDNILQVPRNFSKKLKDDIIPYIGKEATQQMLADKRNPKQTLAEIFAELREEGMEKGMKKGMKKGIEKERKEAKETISHIVQELIRENFSDEQIVRITKVELDQVKKIRETLES